MFSEIRCKIFLLISVGVMCLTLPLSAQLKREGLIFSEVYLNDKEPDKSWLEIYNPTLKPLVLKKLRFYQILTPNIIPEELVERGDLQLFPHECLVICANKSKLKFGRDIKIKLIELNVINQFGIGGFFSLRTQGQGDEGVDTFRYGEPKITAKFESQLGGYVVSFSNSMMSYKRSIKDSLPVFTLQNPSPGYVNLEFE